MKMRVSEIRVNQGLGVFSFRFGKEIDEDAPLLSAPL